MAIDRKLRNEETVRLTVSLLATHVFSCRLSSPDYIFPLLISARFRSPWRKWKGLLYSMPVWHDSTKYIYCAKWHHNALHRPNSENQVNSLLNVNPVSIPQIPYLHLLRWPKRTPGCRSQGTLRVSIAATSPAISFLFRNWP